MTPNTDWRWLEEIRLRNTASILYKDKDRTVLEPIDEDKDKLIACIKEMRSALEKSADSDYWQEHRYPGTSGFQSQREYIKETLTRCAEGKFEEKK